MNEWKIVIKANGVALVQIKQYLDTLTTEDAMFARNQTKKGSTENSFWKLKELMQKQHQYEHRRTKIVIWVHSTQNHQFHILHI